MDGRNHTSITLIELLGFQMFYTFKIPFSIVIGIFYILTVTGNIMIVTLVSLSPRLHSPMFIFLSHLSLLDITLTTNVVPVMTYGIMKGQVTMTLHACITQFHFFSNAIASECLLLAVMSYDRYMAICKPLRYISVMHNEHCIWLVIFCWVLGFIATSGVVVLISRLEFCGPNVIDHFFCDFAPILHLSCSDISTLKLGQMLLSAPMTLFPALFIIVTYICILIAILRISSTSGRKKAFSTCSSHLAVVGTFYGSLITLYVVPSTRNLKFANKALSLLFTVFTPLFNPIIYSLRNLEVREALIKYICVLKEKHLLIY